MSRGTLIARIAGLMLIAGATAYSLSRCVLVPLRCARAASRGAAALDADERQRDYATRRLATRVRANLRGCECVSAPNAHIAFILGGVSATLGDDRAAVTEYERALILERRPEIYFGLGMAQRALDRSAAMENLTRACAFDPARLADIPYQEIRDEVEGRLRATYGADWTP